MFYEFVIAGLVISGVVSPILIVLNYIGLITLPRMFI